MLLISERFDISAVVAWIVAYKSGYTINPHDFFSCWDENTSTEFVSSGNDRVSSFVSHF